MVKLTIENMISIELDDSICDRLRKYEKDFWRGNQNMLDSHTTLINTIFDKYLSPSGQPDFSEFMHYLVTPQPYMVFCDILRKFTPKEFVSLVADLFREMGGNVTLGAAGPNEVIDILCKTAEGDYIVQCKKWKAKVGVPVVREVFGAAVKRQAKGVFIVAASEFTSTAVDFLIDLRPPPVRLIDGKELFDLMNQHMPSVVADIQEGIWKSQKGSETVNEATP